MYDYRLDEDNPAQIAFQELQKVPGILKKYYEPYQQQGMQVDPMLMQQYAQMFSNPGEFFSNMAQGYQESPGYRRSLEQALGAGSNAAAAGGMLGSPLHQEGAMQTARDISSQDFHQYMQNLMQMMGFGGQGLGNFSQRGFQAGTGLGSGLAGLQSERAQYGYGGKAAENAAEEANKRSRMQALGAIGGGIGSLFGMF